MSANFLLTETQGKMKYYEAVCRIPKAVPNLMQPLKGSKFGIVQIPFWTICCYFFILNSFDRGKVNKDWKPPVSSLYFKHTFLAAVSYVQCRHDKSISFLIKEHFPKCQTINLKFICPLKALMKRGKHFF